MPNNNKNTAKARAKARIKMLENKAQKETLTVLSYGIGQDSTVLFFKAIFDKDFKKKYIPGKFIVVSAETGNEYPETYEYSKYMAKIAKQHGIEYHHLDFIYTAESWAEGITQKMRKNRFIFQAGGKKSCTSSLKIAPIYKWLNEWIAKNNPSYPQKAHGKPALVKFAQDHGKIKVMIGFAKGEEKRVAKKADENIWMQESIKKIYPLIDMGMDRHDCQDYVRDLGYKVPVPSNCMKCMFQSDQELMLLAKKYPDEWQEWIDLEQAKIYRYKGEKKNYGVYGAKLLPEKLKLAIEKHGDLSIAELEKYRFSHGTCRNTSY